MRKLSIKVELSEKEDALIYYEKTLGENITIQKRATVIYYASKGIKTITGLHRKCGYTRVFIRSTLKGYSEKGINYIYECSRGIKKSALDKIESEVLEEFERNPPASISEAVSRIREKFGIHLTETPVRNWLRKKGFVTSNQSRYRQKLT